MLNRNLRDDIEITSSKYSKERDYWINKLSGELFKSGIDYDFPNTGEKEYVMEKISFTLSQEIYIGLTKLRNGSDQLLHTILTAGVVLLLHKYTNNEDIILGMPIYGQDVKEDKLLNTVLTLRNQFESDMSFKDLLILVRKTITQAVENQNYPVEKLLELLNIPQNKNQFSLFDIVIILKNIHERKFIENIKPNIIFSFNRKDNYIEGMIEYNLNLYKKESIERVISHFILLLQKAISNINLKLDYIEILSENEKQQILYDFNNIENDYTINKTIHEVFEEQVKKKPNNIAVVFEERKLTYKELNARANQLARVLRSNGVKADSIVGIMVEKSIDMVVGIMGILKAGGVYLPLDPKYPKKRIAYMLKDSKVDILLTQNKFRENIDLVNTIIDIKGDKVNDEDSSNLNIISKSTDLAYIIYTSGSTGKPKGVMIEHKGVLNIKECYKQIFEINDKDRIIQFASMSFDASVEEIFKTLLNGAELHILTKEIINNYYKFENYIIEKQITIATLPPTYVNNLDLNKIKGLKYLATAGSSLSVDLYNKIKDNEINYVNAYGPTESTICASVWKPNIRENINNKVPIGVPINNTRIYIVDKNNKLKPIGVAGELCISGIGLARGYINNKEKTEEKFIDNPFEVGAKLYKTGDFARWLPDGNIEFLGRMDDQVKVRGYRVELGEIESTILKHEDIKEAVVITKEDNIGSKYLCSYFISEKKIVMSELRDYLLKELPEFIIPSNFIQIKKMPLTPNGKIDKKALAEVDCKFNTGIKYVAPTNEVEKQLVEIWKEVLGIEGEIGIKDNFFELGGHSLKATILISKIHKEFNIEVPLKEIFKGGTIEAISEYIGNSKQSIYESIRRVGMRKYYPLSSAQRRMYIINSLDKDCLNYNMPTVIVLEGRVNRDKFEEVFRKLINRHEVLRTSFEIVGGEPVQIIKGYTQFEIEYLEVYEDNIQKRVDEFIRPFNLGKGPLFRTRLIKETEERYILMIDIHHIISDGVSINILINEFLRLYEGEDLESLYIQYKDYAVWQQNILESKELKKQEKYWLDKFKGEVPVLNIQTDYPRPSVQSFDGSSIDFKINKELSQKLYKLGRENNATLYMVLLTVYNILLYKYTGQEDIVVGSPVANRSHSDLQNMLGMFVNTLAMRNKPSGEKTFLQFLIEVKKNALEAYENQDYQFEELIEKIQARRDISRHTLFDTMFVLQNLVFSEIEINNLKISPYELKTKMSKFDITLTAIEKEKEIHINIEYSTKLFRRDSIERLAKHFNNTLQIITDNSELKIKDIDILSKEEKRQIYDFNNTQVDYPKDKTIHELFKDQVEKNPENIALVHGEERITYGELNERSNVLAWRLREAGVGAESLVGIMIERSIEMVVAILAILKAGGAYLPIDVSYPKERIEYILMDSNSGHLLSRAKYITDLQYAGTLLDIQDEEAKGKNKEELENITKSENLAYVIYTSGSTGQPKGVMIEHRNLTNQIIGLIEDYGYGKMNNHMLYSNITFDVSVQHIFTALCGGSVLHLMTDRLESDYHELYRYVQKNKIQFIDMVPAQMEAMVEHLGGNNTDFRLVLGGEAFPVSLHHRIVEKMQDCSIYNVYGPTETTINALIYQCKKHERGRAIPIGRPVRNYRVYIINENNQLQPIGVPGELCISGDGLARGYLNQSKLTEEKFVENPFESRKKMYRTGDLVRWLPDGNIEFLGRIDQQVKIRGLRIELEEIENKLLNHDDIKEVVVIAKEDEEQNKYLCAYIVAEKKYIVEELEDYLSGKLPKYMIPSHFINIEKMPLTSSGKIDRKALPKPNIKFSSEVEYVEPRNEIEKKLVKMWSEILSFKGKIGVRDNFFKLGGHSLRATILISKIHKELNVEVPLLEIFKNGTIEKISDYINKASESRHKTIDNVETREYYPLSSAQKRMYVLNKLDENSLNYNMPIVMTIIGKLDEHKFKEAFTKLIKRHETLRTNFEIVDGEPVQRIKENVKFKIEDIQSDKNSIQEKIYQFIRPFDLSKGPLLRVGLIRELEDKHILIVDMHHIISDGISVELIINEFSRLYLGEKLNPLRIQYKDYAIWQNNMLAGEEIRCQEKYWLDRFSGEIPVLNMPTDYPRPRVKSFEGSSIGFTLGKEETKGLERIARENNATLYMILLAAYNILLYRYTGQEDIIVGSPIANRPHADLENILGMFVNTLAMRNNPAGEKTFKEFLVEVKEKALEAYKNQDYQFEELVEKLDIARDISRNPLFDALFVFQNMELGEIELKDLKIQPYKYENNISKFDISLSAVEVKEGIQFNIEYSTQLFNVETIEGLIEHFKNIISGIVNNPKIKLSEIDILTAQEKERILYDFNDTSVDYPRDKVIHQLFEKQVERTPNKTAIIYKNNKLTYKELNEKSNSLARLLRSKGVGRDAVVGIMLERSIEMVISIMAVLKAGGATMPIDPEYPQARIEYILRDSGAIKLLVNNKTNMERDIEYEGEVINIDGEGLSEENIANLENINTPDDLIYLVYTSGTTGKPKGVMVEHKNMVNLISYEYEYTALEFSGRTPQFAAMSFDACYQEIFSILLSGGGLYIIDKDMRKDVNKFLDLVRQKEMNTLILPTAYLKSISNHEEYLDKLSDSIEHIITAGEQLIISDKLKRALKEKEIYLHNHYGPSETHVVTTLMLDYKGDIPNIPTIGRPISNTRIHILSKNGRLQPVGVAGELYITGDSVGRGYINKLELTKEKFVEDPFKPEERMYRTGDLARWLPDGNIEFLGRIDNQVKIRGYRIEISEIEITLKKQAGVKEAVVLVRTDSTQFKYLCGYIVKKEHASIKEIKEGVRKELPEYMIPGVIVELDAIPLTNNGKVDRKALLNIKTTILKEKEYQAPRNAIEEKLVEIWKKVLGIEVDIGIHDNFFELGGHSIKAIKLLASIHNELGTKLDYHVLYSNPRISDISALIHYDDNQENSIIRPLEAQEYYETSYVQKRMWLLNQLNTTNTAYNMPGKITIRDEDPEEIIEAVLNTLVMKHESFRTSFVERNGDVFQKIETYKPIKVEIQDLMNLASEEKQQKMLKIEAQIFNTVFDLAQPPLFRIKSIKLDRAHYEIVFCMHHIISDGWSFEIIKNDFYDFYNSYKLGKSIHKKALKIQYKDFAYWQNRMIEKNTEKSIEYWQTKLNNYPEKLKLPERIKSKHYDNDGYYSVLIEKGISDQINSTIVKNHASLFTLFLSSLYVLLNKLTGQKDIIIGTVVSGREHYETENIVGCLVNTLLLREKILKEEQFDNFLKRVSKNVAQALTYQTYPLELVLEKLGIRYPDIQIFLNVLNISEENNLTHYSNSHKSEIFRVKFDIMFYIVPSKDGIGLTCGYKKNKFNDSDIQYILNQYINVIKEVATKSYKLISELGSKKRRALGKSGGE